MLSKKLLCLSSAVAMTVATSALADTLTIATVNNGDMIRMQGLTDDFTKKTATQLSGSLWKKMSCGNA